MNFLKNTILLIVSPSEGWRKLRKFSIPTQTILAHLFYPLLSVLALSSIVPYIVDNLTIYQTIINASLDVIKYFFAFYITNYLVTGVFQFSVKTKNAANKTNVFLAYNFAILILLNILRNSLPGFPFLDVIPFYICFVIYKGITFFDFPEQANKIGFILLVSASVLVLPFGIKCIFEQLIPGYLPQ